MIPPVGGVADGQARKLYWTPKHKKNGRNPEMKTLTIILLIWLAILVAAGIWFAVELKHAPEIEPIPKPRHDEGAGKQQ